MFFPTRAAMDRALLLRILEGHEANVVPAGEQGNERASVDLSAPPNLGMVYSMLTDCHRQAVTVSRGVWALVLVCLLVVARLAT